MADIVDSMIYMLNEPQPVVSAMIHLNRVYFYFDFPTKNEDGSLIYKVAVQVKRYSDDTYEDIIESNFYEFVPGATIYSNNFEVPKHHIFYDIKNGFYTFQINYMYKPEASNAGGNIFYSISTIIKIDNSFPEIYSGYMSKFNTGDLFNIFNKDKKLKLWYEPNTTEYLQKNNIIKSIGSNGYKIIEDVYLNPYSYILGFIGDKTLGFILKTLKDELFIKTINDFFNNTLPSNDEIIFRIHYNDDIYYFIIEGNIQKLLEDNQ